MNRLKFVSKHKGLICLTVLSFFLLIVGFLHIPILKWCGVDVFALRGLLVVIALPIVGAFSVPIAVCSCKWKKLWKEEVSKENEKISKD